MSNPTTGGEATGPPQLPPRASLPDFPPGVQVPGSVSVSPPPPPPPRRSFWSRPWVIVLMVVGTLALSGLVMIGLLLLTSKAASPDREVIRDDFATVGDTKRTDMEELSWDQSGGTLNLSPTGDQWVRLDFAIPSTRAVKVVATVTQPAYSDTSGELAWGVGVLDMASEQGVALVCRPGEAPRLYDYTSGDALGFGGGGGTCTETMTMTLEVSGSLVTFETDTGGSLVYSGAITYRSFDSVNVNMQTDKPDQVLRVEEIAGYSP